MDIAKEKLSALPEEIDIKQDSGPETDMPINDDSNIYETLKSPENTRRINRSDLYRVDGLTASEGTDFESLDNVVDRSKHEIKLEYCPSIRSWNSRRSFVEEFTDIRSSVAAELSTAQAINTELKDSYERDFQRSLSETDWLYEKKDSEELTESIAQSYDLNNDKETRSYISSYIPRENSIYQVRSRRRSASIISVTSSETYSQTSVEMETSNIPKSLTVSNRENSTPNSQQHAAILRYYSYRHMNNKFDRHVSGRYTAHMKEKYCPKLMLSDDVFRDEIGTVSQSKNANNLGSLMITSDSFV